MRRLVALTAWVPAFCACTNVLGENFQHYVGEPAACSPVNPREASPRQFVACTADQTCLLGNADGATDPTNQHASCLPIHGTLRQASACTYGNDCGPGAFCSLDLGCTEYCALGGSTCRDGVPCVAFSAPANIGGTEFGFCAPPCDPIDQRACPGKCSFVLGVGAPITVCVVRSGTGAPGAGCVQDSDCLPGLACDNVAQRCTRYCRIGSNDCGSRACLSAGEPTLSYGGATYGFCGV